MPIRITLGKLIDAARIEADLRRDFPNLKIKRGVFGSVKVCPQFNLLVCFIVGTGTVKIYATFPLWYAFFFPQGRDGWGYSDDEKRVAEKTYEKWFRNQYRDYL